MVMVYWCGIATKGKGADSAANVSSKMRKESHPVIAHTQCFHTPSNNTHTQ
jgi:hypothetical protein